MMAHHGAPLWWGAVPVAGGTIREDWFWCVYGFSRQGALDEVEESIEPKPFGHQNLLADRTDRIWGSVI
jgi:hypothetical protein